MIRLLLTGFFVLLSCSIAIAQNTPMQAVLQDHSDLIVKSSRKTIAPAIAGITESGLPQAQDVLQSWQGKSMWQRKSDGLFFRAEKLDSKTYQLHDFDSGDTVGTFPKSELKQIKPNSGIRALIGASLVKFQLNDPDPERRRAALISIQRNPSAAVLEPLRASISSEADAGLKAMKFRAEQLLTISYGTNQAARIRAIEHMAGDLGVDARATLSRLLETRTDVFANAPPDTANVARVLRVGETITTAAAYQLLVDRALAPPLISSNDIRLSLTQHVADDKVGGVSVETLAQPEQRQRAYSALVDEGLAAPAPTQAEMGASLSQFVFAELYGEPSKQVTQAAEKAMQSTELNVGVNQAVDLALDGVSLASIYFLAAIGLAITFGVMGVINMAHGEFIMMGAYTGYVVQQVIPNHTVSIIVAIPLAFAITFAAGVAMERLVIRWLYNRPLETLLATFGVSIALQQLAKNIFGTQARPLTAPAWLDGAWVLNDVVSISYIRIAIFVLAIGFLALFLFIMRRTRLGLETRAVTQNPSMAASMGINPNRVNMLTFGLGSGIAGVAGVAIGLFAKVTSELGSDYIVQSFMTVVVGGVGNIWGTLFGAAMIGFMQKGIEWLNPSNTLAAQTFMIVFIIIFIQFRPRGIIALKGRAAGD